jgi:hypothetical protein
MIESFDILFSIFEFSAPHIQHENIHLVTHFVTTSDHTLPPSDHGGGIEASAASATLQVALQWALVRPLPHVWLGKCPSV